MNDNTNNIPVYAEPEGVDYIIIKVKESVINGEHGGDLYDTTRRAWRAKLETAMPYRYVLSVVGGVVQEVYKVSRWYTSPDEASRIEFEGEVAEFSVRNLFVGKMIPECYRQKGLASPFLYKKKAGAPVAEPAPVENTDAEALKAAARKKVEEAAIKAKAEADARAAAAAALAKAETEAKAKAEAEAKAKAEAEAKAKAEAEAKTKAGNVAKCEDNGDGKLVLKQGNNKLFFKLEEGHAIVVSEYDGMWDEEPQGEITIPDAVSYDGRIVKVIRIARLAFANCTKLTKVNLSTNIACIEEKAFYACTGLQSIDFKKVTTIGQSAFEKCTGLQSIDFNNVTTIGQSAFQGCTGLQSIDFKNVTTIGQSAFQYCHGLQSIDFKNVTTIGQSAFYGCTGLQNIDFKNVTTIGPMAFYGCTGLQNIDFKNVTTIGSSAFYGCKGLTKVIIPSGIKEIPYEAFKQCEKLEKAIIPASVEKIGDGAFEYCYALGNVVIPNKQCGLGYDAFYRIKGQVIR